MERLLRNGTLASPRQPPESRASHPHDFRGLAIASISRKTATIAAPAKPAASAAPAAPTTACQQVSPAQPGSAAGAECPTASPMLQTCKPACCHQAITVSKATSSSISSEASEKRRYRTASKQHIDGMRYRDECSRACSAVCAAYRSVTSFRHILSLLPASLNAKVEEARGNFIGNVPRASEHSTCNIGPLRAALLTLSPPLLTF